MLSPVIHILPLAKVRRSRLLPIAGEVLVRTGQRIIANDVVATANTAPKHLLLDVARGLGVAQDKVAQFIELGVGDDVEEGDVVARRGTLGKRIVRSPVSGKIVLISEGQVLLQVKTTPYELKAGLPGTIFDVIPDRGVIVEATGALIQGVWGNGRVDIGIMSLVGQPLDHVLVPDQIDVSKRANVIVGGHCAQADVLHCAAERRLRGLILASLASNLVPLATEMPYPILLTEGFGHLPMSAVAYELLSINDGREVVVNGEPYDRRTGTRPDVLVPMPDKDSLEVPLDIDTLVPGQCVRITRAPYQGEIATLEAILPGFTVFFNGLRAPGANIRLENGDSVLVPLANLEILN